MTPEVYDVLHRLFGLVEALERRVTYLEDNIAEDVGVSFAYSADREDYADAKAQVVDALNRAAGNRPVP